ncbi:hypothetical protein [Streptomyces sp. NBC_01314]|uniref:hypothetical protein n=1 Tax=Streptomyces sp. NBC_01314 TaxID=2903821 RepID=UPI00308D8481|nr:hypothetical protein OG622_28760 [Streptomyces sp. NBC_01314]
MRPSTDRAAEGTHPTAFDGLKPLAEKAVQTFNQSLAVCGADIRHLKELLAAKQDEYDGLHAGREHAQRMLEILESAETRTVAPHPAADPSQEAVPPQPDETPAADIPSPRDSEPADHPEPSAPNSDGGRGVIKIQGEESLRLLEMMAGKPDHAWSAYEVAAALGNIDRREVRRVRSGLTYLTRKTVLERLKGKDSRAMPGITAPGEAKVRYRIAAPWERA